MKFLTPKYQYITGYLIITMLILSFLVSCKKENQAPTCNIISPVTNSEFVIGDEILIEVEASDSDGKVKKVQIYVEDELIDEIAEEPYKMVWDSKDAIPGNVALRAVAFDNKDKSSSHTIEIALVTNHLPPVADFSAASFFGNAPFTVNFIDQSTNEPSSWIWEFGDGTYSEEQNPTHLYEQVGNYTVTLTVQNKYGQNTKRAIDVIQVFEELNAEFSYSNSVGYTSWEVNFTDISEGSYDEWLWDFGDGSTSTEQHPVHVYEQGGIYTVSLSINNLHFSDTETKENILLIHNSCPGAETLTDVDGNVYGTVLIGDQCWMRENLKVTKYSDWTGMFYVSSQIEWWENYEAPLYCYSYDNQSNFNKYGYLYNQRAACRGESSTEIPSNVQGICPDGWHIPSPGEWEILINGFGGSNVAGEALKEDDSWWGNYTGTNESGFAGKPAGTRIGHEWVDFEDGGYFHSSDKNTCMQINGYNHKAELRNHGIQQGLSVRCLKDY